MKLGEAGEAFFVVENEGGPEDIPAYLLTSPIPSPAATEETDMEPFSLDGTDPLGESTLSTGGSCKY